MTNAMELNHICKSFGDFALRDVSLSLPTGTICGLVGENGAGKSTLIRILMGALRPDSGSAVTLGGHRNCAGRGLLPGNADGPADGKDHGRRLPPLAAENL